MAAAARRDECVLPARSLGQHSLTATGSGARSTSTASPRKKEKTDKAGVLVFGTDAAIEISAERRGRPAENPGGRRRRNGPISRAAIRLGTAAFPETGQKRIVLISDGNENIGDAMSAVLAAQAARCDDRCRAARRGARERCFGAEARLAQQREKGQTFERKIFAQADKAQSATVRLYRNDQSLGEQKVELNAGKNLFTFPQTLDDAGILQLRRVQVEAAGDQRAAEQPRHRASPMCAAIRASLIVSADPTAGPATGRRAAASRSWK